jgi:uncharacterized protein YjbK
VAPGAELNMQIESELKLELTVEGFDRLRGSLGEALETQEQLNLYYEDGQDVSLWARSGFSVRLREQSGVWVLGVKAAGREEDGWSHRPEWEEQIEAGDFAELLLGGSPMRSAIEKLVGELPGVLADSQLALRGELRNSRTLYRLSDSQAVVELDHFRLPDGNEGHELEFECEDGALQERGEAELRGIFAGLGLDWRPSATSKRRRFEEALRSGET